MLYIVTHFWVWLLAAFAIGVATALLLRESEAKGKISGWLIWASLAFLAGLAVALLNVLLGQNGVWLETALATFAVFLAGAGLTAVVRGGSLLEHKGWALGLIPAALVWIGANAVSGQDLETEIKTRAGSVIKEAGGDPLNVDVSGRDVLLPNDVADRSALVGKLEGVEGVRLVSGIDKLTGEAASLREQALTGAGAAATIAAGAVDAAADAGKAVVADTGKAAVDAGKAVVGAGKGVVADTGKAALGAGKAVVGAGKGVVVDTGKAAVDAGKAVVGAWADPGKASTDQAGGATGAKAGAAKPGSDPAAAKSTAPAKPAGANASALAEKTNAAKAVLATLPAAGNLDAAACQSALTATVALEKIQFRTASATVRLGSANVLDKLAGVMKRCPDVKVEVGGHTDNVGDDESNSALSQRRADAVVKYLTREGVAAGRLTGLGYGSKQPIASNDDDDGKAENRRIEFVVK